MAIKITKHSRYLLLLSLSITFWLAALAPIPKIGQFLAFLVSLSCASRSISVAKQQLTIERKQRLLQVARQEVENLELALQTDAQMQQMEQKYSQNTTYSTEVVEELRESLEALWGEMATVQQPNTSASTSEENRLAITEDFVSESFYLAIKELLSAHGGKTLIIEKILKKGGRSWKEGEQILQAILQEGKDNGW